MKTAGIQRRAFTLVEVLISLAIFALASVVLAAAYLNVLGAYQSVAFRQRGEEEWKLIRSVVLSEADREKVLAGGTLQLSDGGSVRWTASIVPGGVADLFTATVRIEPEVSPGGENIAREQRIPLLRPGWSDPVERDKLRAATQQRLAKQRRQ